MKFFTSSPVAIIPTLAAVLLFTACGSEKRDQQDQAQAHANAKSAGPKDGVWNLEQIQCDGAESNTYTAAVLDNNFELAQKVTFTGATGKREIILAGCSVLVNLDSITYGENTISTHDSSPICAQTPACASNPLCQPLPDMHLTYTYETPIPNSMLIKIPYELGAPFCAGQVAPGSEVKFLYVKQ